MTNTNGRIVETDVLIIGAGPAGASLACFLSSYGIKGIIVDQNSTNADTPRAHITNMAALECLRDIGLDKILMDLASKGNCMVHTRWCHSMAGKEYARIYSWGNDPARKGDYEKASPCEPCDLPQTLLEPQLVRYATLHGFQIRFDSKFLSFEETSTGVTAMILDKVTGVTYTISSKYLFGADGARSQVVAQLGLPLTKGPGGGPALNVLVRADMSHLIQHRTGNLHWVMQPDVDHPDFGWSCIVRMVKPWHEWMFIFFPYPGTVLDRRPSEDEYRRRVQQVIGDDTPVEILRINTCNVNEIVADKYSSKRVFCLGDAVHRHPPFNGLGSNTCIQDAFNLAWKVAYVIQDKAGPELLESYSTERQPVGEGIVRRANQGFRDHSRVWSALGALEKSRADGAAALEELGADSDSGQKRRAELRAAITETNHEFHGLGIEMNQHYISSAVYPETTPRIEPENPDPVLYHIPHALPGRRLPHIWLNTAIPSSPISTIDIAGKGGFTLFTGIGGKSWNTATAAVSSRLGVPMRAVSIGYGQEYEDLYFDWASVRGIDESGCILVRPDRIVAWSHSCMAGDAAWAEQMLLKVMETVLSLNS
ncbi:2,4-dichlorophenol 6-monooxygenase [Ilyonectria destructans]|nr:2,4-dichlorophenol 6-monooxygenase [Ilyonectria destructans]